jgi:hypothetical protein
LRPKPAQTDSSMADWAEALSTRMTGGLAVVKLA